MKIGRAVFKDAVKQFRNQKENENATLLMAPVSEGVYDAEFTRKADETSHECWAQRVHAQGAIPFDRNQTLCSDRPIHAMPLRPQHIDAAEWQVLSLVVDSAAESVTPHMLSQDHPIPIVKTAWNSQVDVPGWNGAYVLNETTKKVNWMRVERRSFLCWVCGSLGGCWVDVDVSDMMKMCKRPRWRTLVQLVPMAWKPRRTCGAVEAADSWNGSIEAPSPTGAVLGVADELGHATSSSSASSSSDTGSELAELLQLGEKHQADTSDEVCQQHNEEALIRRPRTPSGPTPAAKETHLAVHLPYRSRCLVCVKARADVKTHIEFKAKQRGGIA